MGADSEISWPALQQIARSWAGDSAELRECRSLDGGSVATTIAMSLADGRRAVLKVTPHRADRAYAEEARQLGMLREMGLPVPQVYAVHVGSLDSPNSYVLMEHVDGMDLNAARRCCTGEELDSIQAHLAELVLQVHARTSTHYMKVTADEPATYESWPAFYRAMFDPIVKEACATKEMPVKSRKVVHKVHDRLDRLLAHDDVPRLVHWDLWSANLIVRRQDDGNWRIAALLDPALKYAHAEAELAYMDLFHTSTPAFMRAYQSTRKLPPEYHQVRKPVYQLYSLLSDLAFFGSEYLRPAVAAIDRAGTLV